MRAVHQSPEIIFQTLKCSKINQIYSLILSICQDLYFAKKAYLSIMFDKQQDERKRNPLVKWIKMVFIDVIYKAYILIAYYSAFYSALVFYCYYDEPLFCKNNRW